MSVEGGYGWVVVLAAFVTSCITLGTFKGFSLCLFPVQQPLDSSVTVVGTIFAMSQTVCFLLGNMSTDGGYGWVVVLAAFVTSCISLGTFKSFSLFLFPVQQTLDSSVTAVGTIFAMSQTVCFLLAPVAGKVAKVYGCRTSVVAAGTLNFLGLLIGSFAKDIAWFAIGITLLGIGFGFSFTPLLVTVAVYFPTRFALANSVVSTGAAIGMMVLPPLAEVLIRTYGWQWALALLAAVNFNVSACGASVRPPPSRYKQLRSALPEDDGDSVTFSHPGHQEVSCLCCVWTFLRELPEKLSLDILTLAPSYCIYLLIGFLNGAIYSAWLLYLIPHALTRGMDAGQASFLATAGGIGNLVVRIVHGAAIDRGFITAVGLFILLSVADAAAFFLDTISYDYYAVLSVLAVINGASLGTIAIIIPPVAQEVLSGDLFLKGYLITLPFFAVGGVIGGWLAGVLYEMTGNYDTAFIALGGLSTLIAIVTVLERTFAAWRRHRKRSK